MTTSFSPGNDCERTPFECKKKKVEEIVLGKPYRKMSWRCLVVFNRYAEPGWVPLTGLSRRRRASIPKLRRTLLAAEDFGKIIIPSLRILSATW